MKADFAKDEKIVNAAEKNKKLKSIMENSEELSYSETENSVEDLRDTENSRDRFSEGEIDVKGVVSRVRLF